MYMYALKVGTHTRTHARACRSRVKMGRRWS